jgi:DNA primase
VAGGAGRPRVMRRPGGTAVVRLRAVAGRIRESDIAQVRELNRIDEVIGEYVALRRAGAGSVKGLCPFHDEKTPSLNVRPGQGTFHCFGCAKGGDVIAFVMEIEHLSFVEAVERLADRVGFTLTFAGGGASVQRDRGTRARLVEATKLAQEFYAEQLRSPAAKPAREFLAERGFDEAAATMFGCGFAPGGWETLTKHLLGRGFTFEELSKAGLSREGQRGPMDRFHRRLLWPIRNLSGDVVGFGARRIMNDDPIEAKYVNTPDTTLYHKSQVLFGLDLAKREIARRHQAVVVEGYTDVMAMHLAGVPTAVASCGTAFGSEHIGVLRRLLMDDDAFRGEVIFTFDGDEAGQKAALKAFDEDQRFAAQTFVAIAPDGMDPCELRQGKGDTAVRDLVARRLPLFAFAIRAVLREHNLDIAEGRVEALRRTVPLVARIKDVSLRDEYARQLAGWVGWDDMATVLRRVRETANGSGAPASARLSRASAADSTAMRGTAGPQGRGTAGSGGPARDTAGPGGPVWDTAGPGTAGPRGSARGTADPRGPARGTAGSGTAGPRGPARGTEAADGPARPRPDDPRLWSQRETLKIALQAPALAGPVYDSMPADAFTEPAYLALHKAILSAGGTTAGRSGPEWLAAVGAHCPQPTVRSLLTELAVESLNARASDEARYATSVLAGLQATVVAREIAQLKSTLQRLSAVEDADKWHHIWGDLVALEQFYRALREQASGAVG